MLSKFSLWTFQLYWDIQEQQWSPVVHLLAYFLAETYEILKSSLKLLIRLKCSKVSLQKIQTFNKKTIALLDPWIPQMYLEPCQTSLMEIRQLQRSRWRNLSRKQFTPFDYIVNLSPDEVLELFVELNSDLSIHYVKSVQMRSYSWSVFSCIGTE